VRGNKKSSINIIREGARKKAWQRGQAKEQKEGQKGYRRVATAKLQ